MHGCTFGYSDFTVCGELERDRATLIRSPTLASGLTDVGRNNNLAVSPAEADDRIGRLFPALRAKLSPWEAMNA